MSKIVDILKKKQWEHVNHPLKSASVSTISAAIKLLRVEANSLKLVVVDILYFVKLSYR